MHVFSVEIIFVGSINVTVGRAYEERSLFLALRYSDVRLQVSVLIVGSYRDKPFHTRIFGNKICPGGDPSLYPVKINIYRRSAIVHVPVRTTRRWITATIRERVTI